MRTNLESARLVQALEPAIAAAVTANDSSDLGWTLGSSDLSRTETILVLEYVSGLNGGSDIAEWLIERHGIVAHEARAAFVRALEHDQLRTASVLATKYGAEQLLSDPVSVRNLHHSAIGANRKLTAKWIARRFVAVA